MKHRKKRCWKGYKPVKGKRPYSKGSCRKIRKNAKKLTADERWHLLKQSRDGYVKRAMIPLRTAKAMVRAGLPVRRSELRGNPFDLPSRNELLRLKRADARGYAFTKKFSSKQPQNLDMLINKLSMLKGNRDENLVTFFIRKRAKYPRDYIVILKHRKYVDGARVYSAGQKAEGAIGQFATILGAKAKRVGQSDYVFTSYGIRFPEERKKSRPGKLFPNSDMSERYKKRSVRYLVTKKFTAGPMKGLTIVDESPVPFYVGFKPSKPYFGSPYIVTKTQVNFTGKRNLLPYQRH
jgi:hypothetical protein